MDINEYPLTNSEDIEDTDMNEIDDNFVPNVEDTAPKPTGKGKKEPKLNTVVGKIVTRNLRKNTLGVIINDYGVLIECPDSKMYAVGDEIALSHTGVFGMADFKVTGIV